MTELVQYFEGDGEQFEESGHSNGAKYWLARQFAAMLGYDNFAKFQQAINRAIGTCTTLNISVSENFQQVDTQGANGVERDYKLSRFACYLVAMNGDVQKPAVAAAQAYFASLAEAAREYIQNSAAVERVAIRDEITGLERSLGSVARQSGVDQYQFFQNAGYRGMYNMNLNALKTHKGLPDKKRSLLDFMDKRELAGNQFRIVETEAKLIADQTNGQMAAERVAHDVGRKVRKMMIDTDGTRPESIPLTGDIEKVRKGLKQAAKEFTKLDTTAPVKRLPPTT